MLIVLVNLVVCLLGTLDHLVGKQFLTGQLANQVPFTELHHRLLGLFFLRETRCIFLMHLCSQCVLSFLIVVVEGVNYIF